MGAFAADASVFVLLPILLWCALARTIRTGLVVGLVLLALQAWFVVPRGLGWSGRWVPTAMEGLWLFPVVTGVVCLAGLLVERREPTGVAWLLALAGLGFLGAAFLFVFDDGAGPRDEGVLPGPAELRLVEGEGHCGSGNCARIAEATGGRAHEVMRAHLMSRGYAPASPLSGDERLCRRTGLVSAREVCAELKDLSATGLRITWYVNRT